MPEGFIFYPSSLPLFQRERGKKIIRLNILTSYRSIVFISQTPLVNSFISTSRTLAISTDKFYTIRHNKIMINILNKNKTYISFDVFTLAEVLITLGIIRVVAAMTMPVLTEKVNHIVAVNKLKKMYSTLSQAMMFTLAKEGDYSTLGIADNDTNNLSETTGKFLKKTDGS